MRLLKLLITGSEGTIGSILKAGLHHSYDLYGVDKVAASEKHIFCADLADEQQLQAVIKQLVPLPYIVHLAGDARVDADWTSVLENNIIATHNLYAAAKTHGVKRIVYASSNHVTGGFEGYPQAVVDKGAANLISVRDPLRPDSDYGVSKIFGEALAREYYDRFGLESICLRIGMVRRDDDPSKNARSRKIWLSHRDLLQLVKKSLVADVGFGIYYGISNNRDSLWDISNARKVLGYHPEDDASRGGEGAG